MFVHHTHQVGLMTWYPIQVPWCLLYTFNFYSPNGEANVYYYNLYYDNNIDKSTKAFNPNQLNEFYLVLYWRRSLLGLSGNRIS